jgi:NifU-like protein involved in Fe-S cluster formation
LLGFAVSHALVLARFEALLTGSCSFFREIAKHLSLPPVKLHCSMLAEDAIKAAVKDYEAKKAKPAKADE